MMLHNENAPQMGDLHSRNLGHQLIVNLAPLFHWQVCGICDWRYVNGQHHHEDKDLLSRWTMGTGSWSAGSEVADFDCNAATCSIYI